MVVAALGIKDGSRSTTECEGRLSNTGFDEEGKDFD